MSTEHRATPDVGWEDAKENFQPLKAGRKPEALRDATAELRSQEVEEKRRRASGRPRGWFGRRHGSPRRARSPTRRQFWAELAEYRGDDPLEVWLRSAREAACSLGLAFCLGSWLACARRPSRSPSTPSQQVHQVDPRDVQGGRAQG
jgi:hypothetical protein